jgi:hypothetical protein
MAGAAGSATADGACITANTGPLAGAGAEGALGGLGGQRATVQTPVRSTRQRWASEGAGPGECGPWPVAASHPGPPVVPQSQRCSGGAARPKGCGCSLPRLGGPLARVRGAALCCRKLRGSPGSGIPGLHDAGLGCLLAAAAVQDGDPVLRSKSADKARAEGAAEAVAGDDSDPEVVQAERCKCSQGRSMQPVPFRTAENAHPR